MGIGKTLMLEAERWARDLNGATHLFFHVKPDNTVAIRMYEKPDLGYSLHLNEPPSGWVDLERLAQNAGAEGQLVMSKSCV